MAGANTSLEVPMASWLFPPTFLDGGKQTNHPGRCTCGLEKKEHVPGATAKRATLTAVGAFQSKSILQNELIISILDSQEGCICQALRDQFHEPSPAPATKSHWPSRQQCWWLAQRGLESPPSAPGRRAIKLTGKKCPSACWFLICQISKNCG